MSLSCDMSPLSLTATGGRSGCVSVVCRCHVTCLLSLSYSYWWPEWLCECRVSLSCDMSPLSLTATGGRSGCVSVVCRCHVTCLLSLSYSLVSGVAV